MNQLQQLTPAKPGDKTYPWDAADRLIGINYTGTGEQTKLSYDGMGRCAQIQELTNGAVTITRRFLWCGLKRCEERDGFDNVTKRFFQQGEQIYGQPYYFLKDHLGSIWEMTDSTGAVRASYKYDLWGRRTKLTGDLDADMGFTGLFYHLPSQLCDAAFREYDPNSGRWLARDPLGEQVGATLYSYVLNNPVGTIDPLGLCPYNSKRAPNNPDKELQHREITKARLKIAKAGGNVDATIQSTEASKQGANQAATPPAVANAAAEDAAAEAAMDEDAALLAQEEAVARAEAGAIPAAPPLSNPLPLPPTPVPTPPPQPTPTQNAVNAAIKAAKEGEED